ncbi:hypothetical protein FVP60_10720 [Microbacterium mitrae]|uniref:Uncharacterized protein n=2 Tax=Microbacterium mitrae TaxID=664640 RepID=A0A5C8HLR8_9MICO|nr:hypothetical protein FVP60_10720 [Microbacterium mitrae]
MNVLKFVGAVAVLASMSLVMSACTSGTPMPQTEPAVAVTIAIDRDGEADIEMFSVDAVECSAKSIATARAGRVSNYLDVELSGGQV